MELSERCFSKSHGWRQTFVQLSLNISQQRTLFCSYQMMQIEILTL